MESATPAEGFPTDRGTVRRGGSELHFVGGWLDNMAAEGARPFTLDGTGWPSVEHYFQAHKHPGADGAARVREIRAAPTPSEAKRRSYAELKGSIGEGSNHSNRSNHSNHSNSLKITIFPRKFKNFRNNFQHFLKLSAKVRRNFIKI